MSIDAGLVLAAKIAKLAFESRCLAAAVDIADVSVDVGLVATTVIAYSTTVDSGGDAYDDVI